MPPAVVTVTSSKSGSDTAPVNVTGAAFPADPVTAQAPATLTVQQGQQVQLDGSASLNATGFSWAQVAGTPAVTLTNANTAIASFTAPATATTLTFRLTVQGPGGPQTTDEVVTVAGDRPAAWRTPGRPQTVLVGDTVTLDGSASTGATSFLWTQTGGVTVTLSSTTAVKPTFTMPNTADPVIFQLTVTGPGGTDVATVQISPRPDVLTTTRVEFRTGKGEWRVEGTARWSPATRSPSTSATRWPEPGSAPRLRTRSVSGASDSSGRSRTPPGRSASSAPGVASCSLSRSWCATR